MAVHFEGDTNTTLKRILIKESSNGMKFLQWGVPLRLVFADRISAAS
jgi:hypothetical protein